MRLRRHLAVFPAIVQCQQQLDVIRTQSVAVIESLIGKCVQAPTHSVGSVIHRNDHGKARRRYPFKQRRSQRRGLEFREEAPEAPNGLGHIARPDHVRAERDT